MKHTVGRDEDLRRTYSRASCPLAHEKSPTGGLLNAEGSVHAPWGRRWCAGGTCKVSDASAVASASSLEPPRTAPVPLLGPAPHVVIPITLLDACGGKSLGTQICGDHNGGPGGHDACGHNDGGGLAHGRNGNG